MQSSRGGFSLGTFGALTERFFPTPEFLAPRAAGIDISDASIKWMAFTSSESRGKKLSSSGEIPLTRGVVEGGIVRNGHALAEALASVVPHIPDVRFAHAALPEEAAYVFGMHVPEHAPHEQIASMIEFEFDGRVPIQPAAAVYDFDTILERDGVEGQEIGVVVFPRDVAQAYEEAFAGAGITLLSLELEARSIARAVSSSDANEPITLLVDFGRTRTGVAVVKRDIPIFTSTVDIGGGALMDGVKRALNLSTEEAQVYINEEGLAPKGPNSLGKEAVMGVASALSDEIARHYQYWDTRRNAENERVTPVGKIVLIGGSANLHGLPEYIASRVQAPVEYGNIWRHVASFNDYVPPIDRRISLQFATAAGLALRGF